MITIDEQGRPEPNPAGSELETLLGFLDYQRATLEWKTRGLDAAGFGAKVGASSMTLGGLLKHMAHVEDRIGSRSTCTGGPVSRSGIRRDLEDADWMWTLRSERHAGRAPCAVGAQLSRRHVPTSHSRSRAAASSQLTKSTWSNGEAPSLRWVIESHMIEEYARHNGHADLLRESVDGSVGE